MSSDAARLKRRQALVFSLGWCAYASTYLLRKPIGVIKTDLETDVNLTKSQLGWLDFALFMPYALVQMVMGSVADKYGCRKTLTVCLLLAALSMIFFGEFSSFPIYLALLFMNGAAQAPCWPSSIKAITSWFPDDQRNTAVGAFGTCAFVGGIAGTTLTVYLQGVYGWRNVFLLPSMVVAVIALLVGWLLHSPGELEITVPGKVEQASANSTKGNRSLTVLDMLKIPMLPEVAMSVFCLKIVRYCMYMWLPMFLLQNLNYSKTQAGMFSTAFEIGGVVGSLCIGFFIDRLFHGRALLGSSVSFLLSTASLLLFSMTSQSGIVVNTGFMFIAGLFNCGPDSILGGSVPSELGESDGLNAAASVTGFVNGFGSIGTFLEGPIIGWVSQNFGWMGMFYAMIATSLLGTATSFRAAIIYARKKRQECLIESG